MKNMWFWIFLTIFLIYSILIEPDLITVKKLELKSDSMPEMKIVFVSDFHLSKFAKRRMNRIIQTVNKQNADIIISGGDYYIMHSAQPSMDSNKIAKLMSKMKSKYGIYSVLGNHDYYKDGDSIKNALQNEGILVLENSNTSIDINGKTLYIAGISDMQTTYYNLDKALYNTEKPTILISHSPDITPQAKHRADLILSGHTHGGQVRIPFFGAVIVPSKYGKRYESGFIENIVYVIRGLGTSLFKIRFNCAPEITVIDYKSN